MDADTNIKALVAQNQQKADTSSWANFASKGS